MQGPLEFPKHWCFCAMIPRDWTSQTIHNQSINHHNHAKPNQSTDQPFNLHRLTNTNLPSYQITSCLPSPKYAELLKPSNLPFLASFIHTLYIHICFICKGTCQIILQTLLYLLTSCLLTCQPVPPIPIPIPPPFVINSHQSITLYHSDINRPFTYFLC